MYFWRFIAGFTVFFITSAIFLIYGWFLYSTTITQYGPVILWKTLRWPFLTGVLLLIIAIVILILFTHNKNQSIEHYESGLVFRNRGKNETWRWNDISAIQGQVISRSLGFNLGQIRHKFQIVNKLSKEMVIDDRFCQVDSLIEDIKQAIFYPLYAEYAQSYNQGSSIVFGSIQLNKTGITVNNIFYSWENVGKGALKEGNIIFPVITPEKTRQVIVRLDQIPNLEVLVAILKYIGKWQIN